MVINKGWKMKKIIASIALGAFIFTSTLVTTGFAAEKEVVENATTTTAENTATTTATSAAAAGITGMAAVGVIAAVAIIAAAVVAGDSSDSPPAAHGHGHGHGHGH